MHLDNKVLRKQRVRFLDRGVVHEQESPHCGRPGTALAFRDGVLPCGFYLEWQPTLPFRVIIVEPTTSLTCLACIARAS